MTDKAEGLERHQDTERNKLLNRTVDRLETIINHHDPAVDVPINDGVWNILDEVTWERESALLARAEAAEEGLTAAFLAGLYDGKQRALARLAEVEAERDLLHSLVRAYCPMCKGSGAVKAHGTAPLPFRPSEFCDHGIGQARACLSPTDAQEGRE